MKTVDAGVIEEMVARELIRSNIILSEAMEQSFQDHLKTEQSPVGQTILNQLLENARIARREQIPICQDTGVAVFFVEMGEEVRVEGGSIYDAIHRGVKKGYEEGYLRKSMVQDPIFLRENTKDNTPAIIHLTLVPGQELKIQMAPKGGGSENMSQLKMLRPADGVQGIKEFVLQVVEAAGPNPCPPLIVGIGVGGTMEVAALLAKKALFLPLNAKNPDPRLAELEEEIKEAINDLGIGPMGLGGNTTALDVHIKTHPCHIASLPVAVNLNCHAARHAEIIL